MNILRPKLQNSLKRQANSRKGEEGQSLVEFALIVPVLFLMLVCVAYIAEGVNLQMTLYGAAYEGVRIWAKNPPIGDNKFCSPPACDPNVGGAINFERYVAPAVRQYLSNHGFDGEKVHFYSEDPNRSLQLLNLYANESKYLRIILMYPIDLPIGNFAGEYQRVLVGATCTLRRGT